MSRISGGPCPYCGAPIDGATAARGEHEPEPGDIGVCLHCARVHVFTDGMGLRKTTPEEDAEFATHDLLQRTIAIVKTHGPRNPGRRRLAAPAEGSERP